MRKHNIEQQVSAELTEYFEQARKIKCPPSMKQKLYAKIGLNKQTPWLQSIWFKPVLACSLVAVFSLGFVWQNLHQENQLVAAERDMQIAMHYMQKISEKTLQDANTHGIKPAIIVPVSRSMAQLPMAQI